MSDSAGLVIGALDPSISKAGLIMLARPNRKFELLHCETIKTSPKLSLVERLNIQQRAIARACATHRPAYFIIEKQQGVQVGAFHSGSKNSNNDKTLISYGAGIVAALSMGVEVREVTPQRAKVALLGNSTKTKTKEEKKRVMKIAASKILGVEVTEDEAEAAALAIAYFLMPKHMRLAL